MSAPFKVACIQTNSKRDPDVNIAEVAPLIAEARRQGADLILTPEIVGMLEPVRRQHIAKAEPEASHRVLAAFRRIAAEAGAWLVVGSLSVKLDDGRLANRSFLVDPHGDVQARYDKIHMFDVQLEGGETYRESATFRSGDRAVVAATPWGPFGMSVCYDLRFAHLYRALAHAGAIYLSIPAAFTRPTGRAHWHVLIRARAIETGCFVFAPAQCGEHADGRKTYGQSLIVAPWGEILAEGSADTVGIITAEIDPAKVWEARRMVPSLEHDRPFAAPDPIKADTVPGDPSARAAGA